VHPDQSNSRAGITPQGVKALAVVSDAKAHALLVHTEFNAHALRLTMFDGVAKRFLGDAKQTQGDIFGDLEGNVGPSELNFNLLLPANFLAKPIESRHQADVLQPARVQLMRERM